MGRIDPRGLEGEVRPEDRRSVRAAQRAFSDSMELAVQVVDDTEAHHETADALFHHLPDGVHRSMHGPVLRERHAQYIDHQEHDEPEGPARSEAHQWERSFQGDPFVLDRKMDQAGDGEPNDHIHQCGQAQIQA